MATNSGELTDSDVVFLSGKISTQDDLMKFGIDGLKLSYNKIKSSLTNHPRDIQSAVHDVLQAWVVSQENRCQAMVNIVSALESCGLREILDKLRQHREEISLHTGISKERFTEIQKWTRESLRTKPFCLALGKEWTQRPNKIDLREIFTDLSWIRKHRKAYTVEQEDLKNITQILSEEQLGDDGPVRILVQAGGGMGKSTATKYLAISWADGTSDELKKFDFVFHISLKHVKVNSGSIAEIIVAQHNGLKANKVKGPEIESILDSDEYKVLVLLDGHDEYNTGRNADIDETIKKEKLWNCWMILTSRETEKIKDLKEYMDAEVEIHGFSEEMIEKYIMKALGSEEKAGELLLEANHSGLKIHNMEISLDERRLFPNPIITSRGTSMLQVPILLHMICTLFLCDEKLPMNLTGILNAIVYRCMNRETRRSNVQEANQRERNIFIKLGKLAWEGLNTTDKKLVFEKEEIIRAAGEEALVLGLLFGTENLTPQEEETDVFCFLHLMLQEFVAAIYVASLNKSNLRSLFPSWKSIWNHRDVFVYACSLTSELPKFLEVLYLSWQSFSESSAQELKSILSLISRETQICPFHNKYFNFVTGHITEHAIVHIPSRMYVFTDLNTIPQLFHMYLIISPTTMSSKNVEYIICENHDKADFSNAECIIDARFDSEMCTILEILSQIQKHQQLQVTYFYLRGVFLGLTKGLLNSKFVKTVTTSFLRNIRLNRNIINFGIGSSSLPAPVFRHVLEQLAGCDQLECLDFESIDASVPEELGQTIRTSKSLQTVKLIDLKMKTHVCRSVMFGLSHCLYLVILNLDSSPLTNCLPLLFGKENNRLFKLERLELGNCQLSPSDVQSISDAAKKGKLVKLQHLDLSQKTLTDLLGPFFCGPKHPGFPSLEEWNLASTRLVKNDIISVGKAVSRNKLPNLEILSLKSSVLTDCITHLFDNASHYFFLENLDLEKCDLNRNDILALSAAVYSGKLPNCKYLCLSHNILKGCIGDLLGYGLPKLETLSLESCELSGEDVAQICDAMSNNKLPKLRSLHLFKSLMNMNDEIEMLARTCTEHYKNRYFDLSVLLFNTDSKSKHYKRLQDLYSEKLFLQ